MTNLLKKLFSLILLPLTIGSAPLKADWPNWRDYFPSSWSVKRDNLKEWTIPAVGLATLAVGYLGYRYLFQKKQDVLPTAPEQTYDESPPAENDNDMPALKDAYEVKEESLKVTARTLKVLTQTDNASCGLHALKNAIAMLDPNNNFNDLGDPQYFQERAILYKPIVIKKRIKETLKNSLQEYLLNTITYQNLTLKAYISPATKKEHTDRNDVYSFKESVRGIVTSIIDGPAIDTTTVTDFVAQPSSYTIRNTTIIGSLKHALEQHKESTVIAIRKSIEEFERSQNNEKLIEVTNNLKQFDILDLSQLGMRPDLIISQEMAKHGYSAKYLTETARKFNLTHDDIEQLLTAIVSKNYEQFVMELMQEKSAMEQQARAQLWAVERDLSVRDNDDLFTAVYAQAIETNNRRQQEFVLNLLAKYDLILPKNNDLLDNLFNNPYFFSDAQGLWLTGEEVQLIRDTVHEPEQHRIAIIDNTDSINEAWFEIPEAGTIKALLKKANFSYAFLINNTTSALNARGHWFTVILKKVNDSVEFIVLDSTQVEEKTIKHYEGILHALAQKIGLTIK